MRLSDPALIREIEDGDIRKKILHFPHEFIFERIGIEVRDIQSDIAEIFLHDLYHVIETEFRYGQSEDCRIFRSYDGEMDALMLFSPFHDIIDNEVICLEIEEFRSIDSDSISLEFITKVYSSIYLLIIKIIGSLDDFDGKLIVFREFLHIIDLPGIKVLPDCEIYAIVSCFLHKLEDQIQSIAGKGIGAEDA